MRICTTLALALALAFTVTSCKKENKDEGAGSTKVTDTTKTPDKDNPGATDTPPPPPEPEKPLVGDALAKRFVECAGHVSSGDPEKMKICLADSFKAHDASMNMDMGRDELVTMFAAMKKAFPDLKLEPQLVLVNGRTIAAVELFAGTNSGEMMGMMPGAPATPATNKKVGQLFFHRLKIDETNKATEEWVISDTATMMGQLGMGAKDMKTRPAMDKGMDGAPVIVVAADNDVEKANLAAWKKGLEAVNAHKSKDLAAMWADDAVESDLAEAADVSGKKDLQKSMDMFFKAFPDLKVETSEDWAAGDYVVSIGKVSGTHKGPLGPIKKTGKTVSIPYAEVAQFKDGKLVKLWRFRDNMHMAVQLGLMPDPAAVQHAPDAGGGAAPAPAPGDKDKKGADVKAPDKPADTK